MVHLNSKQSLALIAACASLAALVAGCDIPQTETGAVDISVAALSSADVTSVSVSMAPGNQPDAQLSPTGPGTWGALVGSIPALTTGYRFTAKAKDAQGNILYQGTSAVIIIKANTTTPANITAQQVTPPTPFQNTVPIIDSFVVSSNAIAPGEVVTATVAAHDPDVGDSITLAWSTSPPVGIFSAAGTATTRWTAPSAEGDVTLSIAVTDNHGATASSSIVVHVLASNGSGEASTTVRLNTWPVVTTVTVSPGFISSGQPVSLTAVAADPDGDPLAFAWTSTCVSGSFSASSAAETTFTLPSNAAETNCSFDVLVQDGRGGSTHGRATVSVGAPPRLGTPVVTFSVQSADVVDPAGTATFMVEAVDAQGGALTFAWLASGGTLSGQADSAGSSRIGWTAPTTNSASFTVSALVTDALGLVTHFDFAIQTAAP